MVSSMAGFQQPAAGSPGPGLRMPETGGGCGGLSGPGTGPVQPPRRKQPQRVADTPFRRRALKHKGPVPGPRPRNWWTTVTGSPGFPIQ